MNYPDHDQATQPTLNRRDTLKWAAATAATLPGAHMVGAVSDALALASPKRPATALGLVIYDCQLRRKSMLQETGKLDLFAPQRFLEHCHALGTGGMQARLDGLSEHHATALGDWARARSMFIDAIVRPPADRQDLPRFESQIRLAALAGAQAARTVVMPGRRYERFRSLDEFRHFTSRAQTMLELAAPIVEKHRVPLAVENHKDQRIDQRVALLEHIGSDYVGACVDTGNSLALLDDPIEVIEALAPWAKTVHLKDQALKPYEDGFLLGDISLGQGAFDLKHMVRILRKANPGIHFALELITRDALKVPCLTDDYWITMPDVPGRDLARTLRFVRMHQADRLQQVSSLAPRQQVALEDANLSASLRYARETLGI